jgi:hypothetical protein
MDTKFTNTDRELIVKELERIQKARLTPLKPSRKFFKDESGKFYCIFGGRADWHGMPNSVMKQLEQNPSNTVLVIAKKYVSKIDVCVTTAEKIVEQKNNLPRTKVDGYQFHTVLVEDGLYIKEIPDVYLRKVSEIHYGEKLDRLKGLLDVKRIINIDLQDEGQTTGKEQDEELTHTDVQAKIIIIGNFLRYRTYTPDKSKQSKYGVLGELCTERAIPADYLPARQLETVKNIDVIWFDEDGLPTHCFEVERTTDITKGLLRLYQIRKLRIKMFIVSSDGAKRKFETEVHKDPFFHIKNEYLFRTYLELDDFLNTVKKFTENRTVFLNEN